MKRKQTKSAPKDTIPDKRPPKFEKAIAIVSEATEQITCNGATNFPERQKRERERLFRDVTDAFSSLYEDAQRIAFGQEAEEDYSPGGELARLAKKTAPHIVHHDLILELKSRGIEPYFYPLPLPEFTEAFLLLRDLVQWRVGQDGRGLRTVTKMSAELFAWCQARGLPFDNEPDALKRMLARRLAEKCKVCAAVGHLMIAQHSGIESFLDAYAEAISESQTKLQEALEAAARAEKLRKEAQDNAEKSEALRKEAQTNADKAEQALAESQKTLQKGIETIITSLRQNGGKVDGLSVLLNKLPKAVSDALYSRDNYPQKMLEEGQKIREGFKHGEQKGYDWGWLLKKYGYPTDENKQRSFLRTLQNYARRKRK